MMLKKGIKIFQSILLAFFLLSMDVACEQSPQPDSAPSHFKQQKQTLPDTIENQQIKLKLNAPAVRVIETYPNDLTTNNDNVLANFKTRIVTVENGLLNIKINQPVIIEVSPFSDLKRMPNKRFGAQLAGQINELLPRSTYSTFADFADRQEKITKLLSLAGVGILRDLQSYDTRRYQIEKSNGNYNFANTDLMTGLAYKYQMDIVARLSLHSGQPRNLPEGIPADVDSYTQYIRKTVERYDGDNNFGCKWAAPDCYVKGDGQYPDCGNDCKAWAKMHHIKYWETLKEPEPGRRNRVGNEPGLSAENAAYILKISYDAIKSVDKSAQVYFSGMGPVMHGSNQERRTSEGDYLKQLFESNKGIVFDIFGFDAYTQDLCEKASEQLSGILTYRNYNQPLWIGQIAAPDIVNPGPFGGSERRQSEDMVKIFTRAFACGVEKVFWGDFLDSSKENKLAPGRPNGGKRIMQATGLFYTETWELKPAYFTFKLLSSELDNIRKIEKIADNIFKFSFNGRSDIYIVWPARQVDQLGVDR